MLLSTWNSEYALQLQSMKTICCCYVRQPMCLLMLFRYDKIHFHQLGLSKLIKAMLKSLHVLLGLSPAWNRYPQGSYKKGAS